jgi:hypothetical protein
MRDQTENQEIYNKNTTWTVNTDELNYLEKLNYLRSEIMNDLYNKNTTWIINEKSSEE